MNLILHLRARTESRSGSGQWKESVAVESLDPRKTAIVLCDVWDRHWCAGATRRCEALAHKVEKVVARARAAGVQIIHAPSECMAFYDQTPQRRRMKETVRAEPPPLRQFADPHLPIDDADGGCDDSPPCRMYKAWTRQNPAIHIAKEDAVSDSGDEIYSFLRQRGITSLLVMGVHTNMCVLNRSFAIKAMTRRSIRCILVRDLTDTMYNPKSRPFVPHDQGTALVVEHIEKYWCPSIESSDLLR